MVIAARPIAIARELCPGTVGAVGVDGVGAVAVYLGCRTLPCHARCGIPAGAVVVLSQVLHHQVVPVNLHDVVERTAGPRFEASAIGECFDSFTLHEGIGTGGTKTCHKVMSPLACIATLHEALLTHHVERCASQSCILAHRLQVLAVFHSDASSCSLQRDTRSRQMLEVDQSHPAIMRIFYRNTRPAVVFVVDVPWVKTRFERHVLDARFSYLTLVVDDSHITGAERYVLVNVLLVVNIGCLAGGVKAHCQRSIEHEGITLHIGYCSAPIQINVAWFPRQGIYAAAKDSATHRLDPRRRALSYDFHVVAYPTCILETLWQSHANLFRSQLHHLVHPQCVLAVSLVLTALNTEQ